MLMPVLSITAIGVVVGLVAWVLDGRITGPVVGGVLGAWAGFLVGAPFGMLMDSWARTGNRFIVVSHVAAVVGAAAVSIREHQLAVRPDHLDEVVVHADVRR